MSEIVYQDRYTTIIHGNITEVLAETIPASSIQMVMTSVPYWRQRFYGGEGSWGWEDSVYKWIEHMVLAGRLIHRVLKPDGVLFLNIGDKWGGSSPGSSYGDKRNMEAPEEFDDQGLDPGLRAKPATKDEVNRTGNLMNLPWRVAIKLQDEKLFDLVNDLIWHKPDRVVQSYQRKFVDTYEPIFFMAKDESKYKFYRDKIGVSKRDTRVTTMKDEKQAESQAVEEAMQSGLFPDLAPEYGPDNPPPFGTPEYKEWYNTVRPKQAWHDHKNDAQEGQHRTRGKVLRHPSGSNPGDLWSVSNPGDPFFRKEGVKPARMWPSWPYALCILPIVATTDENDIVLDPFCGSGTLGVVAKELGRRSILIDTDRESCLVAAARVMAAKIPLAGKQIALAPKP